MALIKCKECGTDVSSKAESCPKCGARVAAKPMGCGTLIGVIILGGIIVSAYSSIFSPSSSNSASSSTSASTTATTAQQTPTAAPPAPGSQWSYYEHDDPMGKGVVYQAEVHSSNTVNFSSPYSGAQFAFLSLRTHPRHGKDIMLRIEKGQFLCRSYEDCTVLIRFDDESAVRYAAIGPSDNKTTIIFIRNYGRFAQKMLKASRVRIAAEIYKEGAPAFEFDVSGFDKNHYTPKK